MPNTSAQPKSADAPGAALEKVNWDLLLESIRNQTCVVCVGPGIFTEAGKTLEQRLAEHLRNQKDLLRIRVYDDGWYHFLDKRQWMQTWYAIKKFYELPCSKAESLLADLVAVKSSIFISFTPDYKLRDAVQNLLGEGNYLFGSYLKKTPFTEQPKPTPERPLVYNLLGELKEKASLVHTYEDMYQYLESASDGNSMAPEIKEKLQNAEHYVFLGLPFDRWYMHLFLHFLKQHEFTGKTKYTPEINVLSEIEEQYNITFVQTEPEVFVKELLRRCGELGLLHPPPPDNPPGEAAQQPPPDGGSPSIALSANPEIAVLKTLVKEDEMDAAFSGFLAFLIENIADTKSGKEMLNFVTMENGNYARIKRALKKGDITQAEFDQKAKAISFKLLENLDETEKLLHQP